MDVSLQKKREYNKRYLVKWRAENSNYMKEWHLSNPEYDKQWHNAHPKYNAQYSSHRKATYPLFKLATNLRILLSIALKRKFWRKTSKLKDYLGCTVGELKVHLENQFTPGMNWDNHTTDGWYTDHIIPLVSATTVEEMIKLCHYTNLQPLWAEDNLRKGGRIGA